MVWTTLVDADTKALVAQAKRALRGRMKGVRGALPRSSVEARSARIVECLSSLPELEAARGVALFWPMEKKNEVDLRALDAALRALGKRLYYPFMTPIEGGFRTGFRRLEDVSLLEARGRGFSEPPVSATAAVRGDVDLVVVPALAVSPDGYRVGYGIGFYDVTLPDVCPPATSVVVAFSFQLVAEAPHDDDDFACDLIVTDEGVSDARPGRGPA